MDPLEKLSPPPAAERRIFCNRTLNLRAIQAIGYDMDYTLIHYREDAWEQRAYEHLRQKFLARSWPVEGLSFHAELMERGLVLDTERGNILLPNRFGFVKQAYHGTHPMDFKSVRETYGRTIVELSQARFVFLNTLFSLSEGCMYAQLVDLLDERQLPGVLGYGDLHAEVRRSLDEAHMEGELKAEILATPDRFVVLDPDTPLALLDQLHAGKRLMLITNSEWGYTQAMMTYAFDPHLPSGMTWQQLFSVIIVSARKPSFFASRNPLLEVVDEEGLLKPVIGGLRPDGVYFGGNAALVEEHLGLTGDQILYVGDHLFGDVHVTKKVLRWRTALILRELEHEIRSTGAFATQQREISRLMEQKEQLEYHHCQLRLDQQRRSKGYGPEGEGRPRAKEAQATMARLREQMQELDEQIGPLAKTSAEVSHPLWGPLMRAGNDKSMLARQVERSADIYTSRVSNFLFQSPFAYLRSPRGSLPHDPLASYGAQEG
jgi:HAD superfamily 5'-nucleotidase-like hydrolase